MTVSVQDTVFRYTANGITTSFAYGCLVLAEADLVVTVDGVVVTSGFTKSGIGSQTGGNVVFTTAPANLASVIVRRLVTLERTTDYQQHGDWAALVINPDFDRLWMAEQQQAEQIERSIKIPVADGALTTELPAAAQRASKVLGFDGNGAVVTYSASSAVTDAGSVNYVPVSGPTAGISVTVQAWLDRLLTAGASLGAALVGFLQAGVGAVSRTVQDKLRERVSVEDYGAVSYDGTDATDATAAFQAAIDAMNLAGGGTVHYTKRYLINSNLIVKDGVHLKGPLAQPDELLPSTAADYDGMQGVLVVNSAATITVNDSAAATHGMVIRKGLNLPFADAATAAAGVAAFAGIAFTVGGAGTYFAHLLILGFDKAIYSTSNERVRCAYVSGDCTNGIDIQACFDIAYVFQCHFWPWTTTHQTWTTNVLLTRTGTAYQFKAIGDWNKWTNCFSYGYALGFVIDSCDNVQAIGCGTDYIGALASTSVGYSVIGTSKDAGIIACQAAAQGTGVLINSTSTSCAARIVSGNFWGNDTYHIRVQDGRAIISGNILRTGAIGVQIDSGSDGAMVIGNDFETVTTPIAGSGIGLDKSTIGSNNFNGCIDTIGSNDSNSNQTTTRNYSVYNSSTGGALLQGRLARGTVVVPTISQAGDAAIRLSGQVYDGAAFRSIGLLRCQADGAPAAGSTPGIWIFSTTPSGATSATDRCSINSSGVLMPLTDNTYSLGQSANRWSAVWAANGTIQTSDARTKKDITSATLGLDFINALRPVSYKWIEGSKRVIRQEVNEDGSPGEIITESVHGTRTHWGLIAQEVKAACDAAGVDFGGWVLTDKDDPDSQQALRYDQFVAPLIKAVQELTERVAALEAR